MLRSFVVSMGPALFQSGAIVSKESSTHEVKNESVSVHTTHDDKYEKTEYQSRPSIKVHQPQTPPDPVNYISPSLTTALSSLVTLKSVQPSQFSITKPFSFAKCSKLMNP